MIDINTYRIRIGCYNQKFRNGKFLCKADYKSKSTNEESSRKVVNAAKISWRIVLVLCLLVCASSRNLQQNRGVGRFFISFPALASKEAGSMTQCQSMMAVGPKCEKNQTQRIKLKEGNFWARYINGNRIERKGIKNSHLNIRSLRYKVIEVKNIIKEQNVHVIGLSECELKKGPNFDLKELKIPGYNLLLPKSWDSAGFARVAVYVKKTFMYRQVFELQDDMVQTIWLKGGFKNSKQIYFCHGYREHKSAIGNTVNDQKIYLERFLAQWEAATVHCNPEEPNEVHICCDMNIDTHNEKWLESSYPLVSLSRMIQSTCSVSNFHQLVSGITRTQYNSVSNMVDMSCIDHVYCNYKHRCSQVKIITNGASDHDQVSYTRYSKDPPSPARVIRKRSYKNFKVDEFIEELDTVDWTEVYACVDVDVAAEVFGRKFRFIVNKHAPWVKIQARKHFLPWLSIQTKGMMKLRDKWKYKAKQLSSSREDNVASVEETEA